MSFAAFFGGDGTTLSWGIALYALAGIVIGLLYFRALLWSTAMFARGARAYTVVMLMIGRFVALGAVLTMVSLQGMFALLAMALGIFIARLVTTRYVQARI